MAKNKIVEIIQNLEPRTEPAEMPAVAEETKSHAEDPLMNLSEVARFCNKDPSTISRWVRDGLLRCVWSPSGLPAVRRSEVVKFYGGSALADKPTG